MRTTDETRIGPTAPLPSRGKSGCPDMALIGDTKHELHTKALPRKSYPSVVGKKSA